MNDSRIIKLLKNFSEKEMKSFGKFIESPFLKPPRNTIALYEYIEKYYPAFDSQKLKKEIVFGKLFPGEEFNERKLINLMADLTRAAEDFLSYVTFNDDEIEFLLNLSKGYMNKELYPESMRVIKAIEKKLIPGFSISKDYISKFRRLTTLKSACYSKLNDFENVIECEKEFFEASSIQFVIDYTQLLRSRDPVLITYGKKIENEFTEIIFETFDLDKLLTRLEKSEYRNKHLISLHYYSLKMLQEPDNVDHFYLLKDLLYKHLSELDREEKYFIFGHLMNYCVRKFDLQKSAFTREGVEIYKKMFENEAYSPSESEPLEVLAYRNVIHFCIRLKEDNWFESFIKNYSQKLSVDYREDMRNFSFANLYFLRKEFENALVSLSKITNEFFLFKSDLKNLMLRIYFELDYIEQAYSMIDSFKHFIRNSKELSKPYKVYYKNFVDYYAALLKIKSKQSKEDPIFIKSNLEKETLIVNKRWLMEKADEMSK